MRNQTLIFLILLGACKGGSGAPEDSRRSIVEDPPVDVEIVTSFCAPAAWDCAEATTWNGIQTIACMNTIGSTISHVNLNEDTEASLDELRTAGQDIVSGLVLAGLEPDSELSMTLLNYLDQVEYGLSNGFLEAYETAHPIPAEVAVILDAGQMDDEPDSVTRGAHIYLLVRDSIDYLGVCE